MHHPYDPELAAALAMMAEVDISDLAAARAAQAGEVAARVAVADTTGVEVSELTAPGPEGAPDVPLRVYRPAGTRGEPLPALYTLHGGGFLLGSPDVDHDTNLGLTRELGAVVVSPDYRLAPEHRYPAALEDCYAGLSTLAKDAAELGIRADRIAVGGDSAGAGLAAALTMLARDRGGPSICFQYLCSPSLDDRLTTPSALLYTDTPVWNRHNAQLGWAAYLGEGVPGTEDVSRYAAPARADVTEVAGLPPAFVSVMHFDPLRDEGIGYAQALLTAGVHAELHVYPGTFHGAIMVEHAAVIRRAAQDTREALRRALWR